MRPSGFYQLNPFEGEKNPCALPVLKIFCIVDILSFQEWKQDIKMAPGAWALLLPLAAIVSASPQSNYDLQVGSDKPIKLIMLGNLLTLLFILQCWIFLPFSGSLNRVSRRSTDLP